MSARFVFIRGYEQKTKAIPGMEAKSMAAFDKVKSGFPGVDNILDFIRMGDNVVWQVNDIDEFRFFALPFVKQARQDGRSITYVRFAQHRPILEDTDGVDVVVFNPDEGFEAFTVAIHEEITRKGRDAFYVFDCLSELQSVWYTDLMMGNFFRVTCPYLFELDTVAYFPIMRGRHSFDAIARIRETTQLLLDVYSNEKWIYLHPLKVWERNSETMFMPHGYLRSTGEFQLIDNGVSISRYYQTIEIREDTMILAAYEVYGHTLYDSLHIVKPVQGETYIEDLGKDIPEYLEYTPNPHKKKDLKFARRIEAYKKRHNQTNAMQ